eukprot:CAMPEP_0198557440 /NCGR_PEP_ID=MMETSP1462-20131121/88621_1 /TAXON_ID=1333877 /ORGANISM="Brandtodinium nutriculum, Strain RCC3387" /LENGTH=35 /DNA_ID= /DNA_START= /DNA_END= /DNA_ORIENTATION=
MTPRINACCNPWATRAEASAERNPGGPATTMQHAK